LEELIKRLRAFRDERDWSQFHTPKDLAISVSVEANELLELFQWRHADLPLDAELAEQIAAEAADVLIYLALLSDRVGFDLIDAANRKVDENERRFPVARSLGVAKPTEVSAGSVASEDG
jgi:NTP pyrophosphatase (non-canonical NTP hydrolase)